MKVSDIPSGEIYVIFTNSGQDDGYGGYNDIVTAEFFQTEKLWQDRIHSYMSANYGRPSFRAGKFKPANVVTKIEITE